MNKDIFNLIRAYIGVILIGIFLCFEFGYFKGNFNLIYGIVSWVMIVVMGLYFFAYGYLTIKHFKKNESR